MVENKGFSKIVIVIITMVLVLSIILISVSGKKATVTKNDEPQYKEKIFGEDIISIEILADEEQLKNMFDNARDETYISADVIVNGTTFKQVGIRPKGNSSLTQVAQQGSQRYSLRLTFDEYIEGQTCFGLDDLVLNNLMADNSYMKEYISYDLMSEIGVETPYYGFANIKINNNNWGLYLAVELYRDSYESRAFGTTDGSLYNVRTMNAGGNDKVANKEATGQLPNSNDTNQMPDMSQIPEAAPNNSDGTGNGKIVTDGNLPNNKGQMGGMGNKGTSGGSLEYVDDETSSYSDIFDNVVGKGQESNYKKVVEAIKALSEGENLETYFNVDEIIRYMAAHTIVVNLDSYSSSMAQNYYLYENGGKVSILPWDYGLAWGGFQSGSSSDVVNFPIDTPVSGVTMESRPLFNQLLSNETYLEKYHQYLQELIDSYFSHGKFEAKVTELDNLINQYVKDDATAFCTYDEYKTAVQELIKLGTLRGESVQGQLNGTVPSTTEAQNANKEALISADSVNLSLLGTMGGNKGGGITPGGNGQMTPPSFNGNDSSENSNGQFIPPDFNGQQPPDFNGSNNSGQTVTPDDTVDGVTSATNKEQSNINGNQ